MGDVSARKKRRGGLMASRFDAGFDTSLLPQWRELMSIDFAAQPNQAFGADGAYVIGGLDFTVANLANARADSGGMRIVNGSGLYIPFPIAGVVSETRYPNQHDTCLLRWQLPAAVAMGVPVIMVHRSANVTASVAHYWGGFAYPGTVNRNLVAVARRKSVDDSTVQAWSGNSTYQGTMTTFAANMTGWVLTSDVLGVWLPDGLSSKLPCTYRGGRDADGAFANPRTATVPLASIVGMAIASLYTATTLAIDTPSAWGAEISLSANSSGAFNGLFTGMKVLAYY